jgi:hypothetical protein
MRFDMNLSQPQDEQAVSSNRVNGVGQKQREREEKAAHIIDGLKSGKCILLLQEVPKIKASHCRAWNCMPYKRTGDRVIRSEYRLMLKDVSFSSSMGNRPSFSAI